MIVKVIVFNEIFQERIGKQKWNDLNEMLKDHLKKKNSIQRQIEAGNKKVINSISQSEISNLVETLKGLKHYGRNVVDALESDPNQSKSNLSTALIIYNSDSNPSIFRRIIKKLFGNM